jgi:predicted signal transduction protein with EAL and GGDEF domain
MPDQSFTPLRTRLRYPFDKVKIDGRFVAALGDDPVAEVIIDAVLLATPSIEKLKAVRPCLRFFSSGDHDGLS